MGSSCHPKYQALRATPNNCRHYQYLRVILVMLLLGLMVDYYLVDAYSLRPRIKYYQMLHLDSSLISAVEAMNRMEINPTNPLF